ncbi:MAG: glycosyltransferase family 2 protein, partial [Candidatus Levybacteria bacterium]|nr:glycosyltransferase family 2 protein [Candidatus Levybacteria bacterium]
MFNGKKVSIVFATYREKNSIRAVIEGFFDTGLVDEVVVVNNNAEPGTDEEVKKTGAKLIYEKKQGYGYTFRTGIREAVGDYIVLCEPDGTYTGKDLEKFLAYSKDFNAVFGSRTNKSMIGPETDMSFFRRWGNIMYGKIIEVFFRTNTLSDIGCTYKLFSKEAMREIEPYFKTVNPLFATELVLLTASKKIPFVEIPV